NISTGTHVHLRSKDDSRARTTSDASIFDSRCALQTVAGRCASRRADRGLGPPGPRRATPKRTRRSRRASEQMCAADRRGVGAFVAAIAALLGAGAAPPPLTNPVGLMPDLRGTWTGTWGGAPVTLVILEQRDAEPVDGLTVGPWQVLGQD